MRYGLYSLFLAFTCVLSLPLFADESTGKSFMLWSASASAQSCMTAECHAALGQAKFVHAPVTDGECLACHSKTDQPHPGPNSIKLVADEPALCLECHENPAQGMAFPHSAVEEGCTGCHSPHQSSFPKFVLQEGGKLCLDCHDDVTEGEFIHGPIRAENCKICHGIHGGENEAMLYLPGKDSCLTCHSGIKEIMDNAKSQHDPVVNGVCWDCHTPHAADFKPFLEDDYPEEFYENFAESEYQLCFNCHDVTGFTYVLTSEATGFRNHNYNLHSFHVLRSEKGRVCKGCHGVHGADQENLLPSRVPGFGKWDIPLTWVTDGEKATCYVGCHRPKTYSTERTIKNP